MRLNDDQIDIIRNAVKEVFGIDAEVWLFGSQIDDQKVGGDIDLYIECQVYEIVEARLSLRNILRERLGDRKIDIITHRRDRSPIPIGELAKHTGERLTLPVITREKAKDLMLEMHNTIGYLANNFPDGTLPIQDGSDSKLKKSWFGVVLASLTLQLIMLKEFFNQHPKVKDELNATLRTLFNEISMGGNLQIETCDVLASMCHAVCHSHWEICSPEIMAFHNTAGGSHGKTIFKRGVITFANLKKLEINLAKALLRIS